MRVALVGPLPPEHGGLTAGGVASHLAGLAQGLLRLGVDLRILTTNASSGAAASLPPHALPLQAPEGWPGLVRATMRDRAGPWSALGLGLRVARYSHVPPAWGAGRRALLGLMLAYRDFLRAVQPDVVHVEHPLERHLVVRLLAELDSLHLPLVVTLHSFHREHADQTIYGLMQPNLRFGDRFIAVSPHVRDEAIALGAAAERVRVIHSGVDIARFHPESMEAARRRLGLAENARMVLFVGNLEPRKAVDRLISAMVPVRAACPEAELVLVGNGASAGQDDQEPRLRELAASLQLQDVVRFEGAVPADNLAHWYNAADVFALPSLSEGQGLVALEAMSCGRPVVASAVGGLLDRISDGCDGFLVPPGNTAALAERLTWLLSDSELRERMGAQARRTVEARFSWERTAEAVLDVYRELGARV